MTPSSNTSRCAPSENKSRRRRPSNFCGPSARIRNRWPGRKTAARRQEADFIARRIRGMLDRQEAIVGQRQPDRTWSPRAVEQRDIAILFRTLSDVQHYEERLQHYGIDYYLVGGHAFYAQQEIYDVIESAAHPGQPCRHDQPGRRVAQPMFSLTDETLFWLAQHPEGLAGGLHSNRLPAETLTTSNRRVDFAARTLRQLRQFERSPVNHRAVERVPLP